MRESVRHISLNMLVVLEALCVHGSTVMVARQLSITQPAVSQCLKRLREIADDPLFIRTPKGLKPTPKCLAIRAQAAAALDICENIVTNKAVSFDPATAERRFSVSIPEQKTPYLFSVLGILLEKQYPRIRADIVRLSEDEGMSALSAGALDLFVGFSGKRDDEKYRSEKITSFECKVICSKMCSLYPNGTLTRSQYLTRPHVKVAQGLDVTLLDNALTSLGLIQKTLLLVPDKESAYELVRQKDCLFIIDRQTAQMLCRQHDDLKILQEKFSLPSIDIYQVWDARCDADPANIWLRSYIKKKCAPS
ncbi:MAG: LysR family transcriptional regulator [Micavibrio aeruginosavorus]|uniref:LysR family transcriptional regulator n=1 Tax=Micavibrio aeruginosavorus TaxID=349221 RepID=A0A7T5UHA7_9BACT|nr:MAG: LysR family transcriptional regulator [Micavibrio aeruginosavorus]